MHRFRNELRNLGVAGRDALLRVRNQNMIRMWGTTSLPAHVHATNEKVRTLHSHIKPSFKKFHWLPRA
jgi:hypothetical protein